MPTNRRFAQTLIVLMDGLGPDYVNRSDMPVVKRMMASGCYGVGKGVLPSVTNVNNASVVTGCFPNRHGIVSNFYFDRATGESVLMEDASFVKRPTVFERASRAGQRSALVAAKDKIRTLLGRGASIAVSAEAPPPELVAAAGPKPPLYSAEENYWTFRAARHLLRNESIDVIYLSTTDYVMHRHAPEAAESLEHLYTLDRMLGEMVDDNPSLRVLLTADHGMNLKTRGIDVARVLAASGVEAEAVPIIRDTRTAHHQNLGGACYVYLNNRRQTRKALDVLRREPGIEEVFPRREAASTFQLAASRIGDLFVLGARDVAFGSLATARQEIHVRSHGSRYEQDVPLLRFNAPESREPRYNLDLVRHLKWPDRA